MCNRYSSTKNEAKLQWRRAVITLAQLLVRYNIAPTSMGPVISLADGQLIRREMTWGARGYDGRLLTNAKSELARHKPMWRNAWAQRRCVIPADGYYEWKTDGRQKLPYRFALKDEALFWFAALWEEEESAAVLEPIDTGEPRSEGRYVILTREPNGDTRPIHNRMPLILTADEIEDWLAPETSREWVPNGIPEGSLRSYRVGPAVGTPGLETPECIQPLKDFREQTEFSF